MILALKINDHWICSQYVCFGIQFEPFHKEAYMGVKSSLLSGPPFCMEASVYGVLEMA